MESCPGQPISNIQGYQEQQNFNTDNYHDHQQKGNECYPKHLSSNQEGVYKVTPNSTSYGETNFSYQQRFNQSDTPVRNRCGSQQERKYSPASSETLTGTEISDIEYPDTPVSCRTKAPPISLKDDNATTYNKNSSHKTSESNDSDTHNLQTPESCCENELQSSQLCMNVTCSVEYQRCQTSCSNDASLSQTASRDSLLNTYVSTSQDQDWTEPPP